MRSALFGNGINIQYGGYENTNESIIIRAIELAKENDYPKHIIVDDPDLIITLLSLLYDECHRILSEENYKYAYSTDEKDSLADFRERYSVRERINITDIGFEDYLLIYDLFCYRNKIVNPDRFEIREIFKRFLIYSIFNKGKVEEIHLNFPKKFCDYLNSFNKIFTTNYDSNIDKSCKYKVLHLHGAFDTKSIVYDAKSFRNQLSDSPIKNYIIDDDYFYLYSNVITDFNGFSKDFVITQHEKANSAIEKFAGVYKNDISLKATIESWSKSNNYIIRNLGESIKMKAQNDELKFDEYYPINDLRELKGTIEIYGLSPNNDTHIFDEIDKNNDLERIIFFYYDETEKYKVKEIIKTKELEFNDVKLFWEEMK